MNYIGNYENWLQPEWIYELLHNTGVARPKEGKRPDSPEEELEYKKARAAGYTDDAVYFYMFDQNSVTFKINPPFITEKHHWWITKMMPGNFMPIHRDPHTLYQKNSKRYWMPLQDWEIGHIFMYENKVITDYKKGDLWQYDDSQTLHGAANIGYSPRLVLQISTYE
jgi:hypothetical protein